MSWQSGYPRQMVVGENALRFGIPLHKFSAIANPKWSNDGFNLRRILQLENRWINR